MDARPAPFSKEHKLQLVSASTVLQLGRCSSSPVHNGTGGKSPQKSPVDHANTSGPGCVSSESCRVNPAGSAGATTLFGRSNPFETDFSVKQLVGEGGFGRIFKCKSKTDGQWYAVKVETFWFKPQAYFNPSEVRDEMMKEALVLARLDHENVCRYFNTWVVGSLVSVDSLREPKNTAKRQPTPVKNHSSATPTGAQQRGSSSSPQLDNWSDLSDLDNDDDTIGEIGGFEDLGFDMLAEDDSDSHTRGLYDISRSKGERSSAAAVHPTPITTTKVSPRGRKRLESASHALSTQIDVYIQMALYEGNSLQHWMDKRTQVSEHESLRIFEQIVAGLKYIHAEGLIHRDMKPANIFLTGRDACVKIGDFGLAKNTLESSLHIDPSQYHVYEDGEIGGQDGADGYANVHSNDGSIGVGTPLYSSPEQTRGLPCDASTDVYSLGVILCELFCMFTTQMERHVVLSQARKGVVPPALVLAYPDVAALITAMVQEDQAMRPSCSDILETTRIMQCRQPQGPELEVCWKGIRKHHSQSTIMASTASKRPSLRDTRFDMVVQALRELNAIEQSNSQLLSQLQVFTSSAAPASGETNNRISELVGDLQRLAEERQEVLGRVMGQEKKQMDRDNR